jgi:integrative and conjugative element protein (TIGR02256 family)
MHLVEQITSICKEAGSVETGGILVGVYSVDLDCAIVTEVSGPTPDSVKRPTSFIRGIFGLQAWLNKLWKKERHYFLGDWHFHPYMLPEPSDRDIIQTKEIALSHQYKCPEPILLITGGDPFDEFFLGAFVYAENQGLIRLPKRKEWNKT